MKIMIIFLLFPVFFLSNIVWSQESVASDKDRIKSLEESVKLLLEENKKLRAEDEKLRERNEKLIKDLQADNEKLKMQILEMLDVELRKRIPEMQKEIVGLLQQLLPKSNRRLFGTATKDDTKYADRLPAQFQNPQHSIDGDRGTACQTYYDGNWSVDLGACFQINHITIFGCYFNLRILDENQKEVYAHSYSSPIRTSYDIAIPNVTGRFVRIALPGSRDGSNCLSEVFIYGTPVK